jgi:Flp pilus assembly protein TadD
MNHGVITMLMGRTVEAEALLRRSLALEREANRGEARLAMPQAALGICLVERGLLDEAEPLLLAADEVFTRTGSGGPVRQFARNALAKLYSMSGRPEQAARYSGPSGRQAR